MRLPICSMLLAPLLMPASANANEESASELPPPSPDLLASKPHSPGQPSMHPAVVVRDGNGEPVLSSGAPADAARTCDGCHDVAWIKAHDGHGSLVADEFNRGPALLPGGNCFLCHVGAADNAARAQVIADGHGDFAETATLQGTGIVVRDGDRWRWQKARFQPDGTLAPAVLGIGRPSSRACGFCHGRVYDNPAPLTFDVSKPDSEAGLLMTDVGGVVFSGQRISDSALNIAGKDRLPRPWDVHAERMVSCASCHFSPNHPAYAFANRGPEHLQFDARRVAITEYLRRPDHRLAKGPSGVFPHRQEGNIRRCESCHDASKVHGFLPRAERHFSALLCESCHIPMAYAPARQETDWTMLTTRHEARVVYRGVDANGFITGFRPLLLPRTQPDGSSRLAPNNVVTTYRWVEQGPSGRRPVSRATLMQAFFVGEAHRPELVRALDRDGDGKLQDRELVLDTQAKVTVARDLLLAAGAKAPTIVAEARSYELHHGASPGRFAARDCATCHEAGSRIDAPFTLTSTPPFGVVPSLADASTPATVVADVSGAFSVVAKPAGLHVFGHTRSRALDGLGLILFAGAIAGAGGHALLRVRGARRRKKERA
jgi:hypothetical protein